MASYRLHHRVSPHCTSRLPQAANRKVTAELTACSPPRIRRGHAFAHREDWADGTTLRAARTILPDEVGVAFFRRLLMERHLCTLRARFSHRSERLAAEVPRASEREPVPIRNRLLRR